MMIRRCQLDFATVLGAPPRPAEERGLGPPRSVQKPPCGGASVTDPGVETAA